MRLFCLITIRASLVALSWTLVGCPPDPFDGDDEAAAARAPIPPSEEGDYYDDYDDYYEEDTDACHLSEYSVADFPEYMLGSYDMIVEGDSFFANAEGELAIFDVSNLEDIELVAGIGEGDLSGDILCFVVSGDTIYVVEMGGVQTFDYGDKDVDPELVHTAEVGGSYYYDNVVLADDLLVLTTRGSEADEPLPILVYPLEDGLPASPVELDVGDGQISTVAARDGYLFSEFISSGFAQTPCLKTVDLSSLDDPEMSNCTEIPSYIQVMEVRGDRLYLGFEENADEEAVWILDISDPMSPEKTGTLQHSQTVDGLTADDQWLYAVIDNDLKVADAAGGEWADYVDVSISLWIDNVAVNETVEDGALYIRQREQVRALSRCSNNSDE